MNPLLVLDQLDDRMQQSVGGRRDAQRFAPPYDQAVQMIDLTCRAPRNLLHRRDASAAIASRVSALVSRNCRLIFFPTWALPGYMTYIIS
jgi:hypothetical protein